jgi:hypothetical protein
MRIVWIWLLLCLPVAGVAQSPADWLTPYERGDRAVSATYEEAIAFYQRLAATYDQATLMPYGLSDVGKPLHLLLLSKHGVFDPLDVKLQRQAFVLINNGIHPGEPCGVDACMMLARDWLQQGSLPDDVVIGIIPLYNIGGALNRGSYSRANQVGPQEHGFRGNARNYDLNRDFIKMDSRNAEAFVQIFQTWRPDLFIDTHTTNGADYQAVMTLIETQHNKLLAPVATFMTDSLTPRLYAHMATAGHIMSPYVNVFGTTPDDGFAGFLDLPRYSTGYAAMFQTPSYVTEAHMLKPYAQRVAATYDFLASLIEISQAHKDSLMFQVQRARQAAAAADSIEVAWTLDTTEVESVMFDGYEARYRPSQVTGQSRLYYDRSQPYRKPVPYLNTYTPTLKVAKPTAYLIPQAYTEVIDRLLANGIPLRTLRQDTLLTVAVSYLDEVQTSETPYEGHYFHAGLKVRRDTQAILYFAGDVVAYTGTWRDPYLVHVLEPLAQDAFFRWNFFDNVLMQKEYFSAYVFEETAAELLAQDPGLSQAFEAQKASDPAFASDARAQLMFIYQRSPYYEITHRRYPVTRWDGGRELPVE